ncbi:transposase [Glaciecola siphonariae]|uniref:Transposase n=1 Tax=Glaciecola siphonariae TaxID=521012 RepID=A0ABV9M0C2_9ALTE
MPNFKPDLSCQSAFIPVDFSEQIIPGTFEYALNHIVNHHLDLRPFDSLYSNEHKGAAAYSPAVMLKIILFAYAHGMISSLRIAKACQTNITLMALSGDTQPHFTSIANFVANMHTQIEPLFTQVLMICEQQQLIGHHMFAIDGCKISSNASKEHSGTHDELARKAIRLRRASQRILAHHIAQDVKGEELPAREAKHKQTLDDTAQRIEAFLDNDANHERLATNKKPIKSNITDNDSAKMLTNKGTIQGYNGVAISDDKHQIIVQAKAWGAVNEQQTLQPAIKQLQQQLSHIGKDDSLLQAKFSADSGFHSKDNLTYLAEQGIDSYIADTGFRSRNPLFQNSQTYHAYQTTKRRKRGYDKPKLFSRGDFHFNRQALMCVCLAGNVMWLTSRKPHTNNDQRYLTFHGYLKDCRTCPVQSQCMRNPPKERGRQVTFPALGKPTKAASLIQIMKDKMDSKQGRREYSKRLGCIEPVFANITKQKKMDYFTLRGQTKVNAQWLMFCLVHNIEKLRGHVL